MHDPSVLPLKPLISAVTLAELSVGSLVTDDGRSGPLVRPAARAYDALIAATALAHELPLFTANPADFTGIDGLELVEVPQPA